MSILEIGAYSFTEAKAMSPNAIWWKIYFLNKRWS